MTKHVKIGGTWQEVSQPYVKIGGTWQECTNVYSKVGGTWQEVWAAAAGGPTVSMSSFSVYSYSEFATAYSNLRYGSNGYEYTNSSDTLDNFSTSRGQWLTSGANNEVWFERTINGTPIGFGLRTDPGAGRLIMTSNRDLATWDATALAAYSSVNLTIKMWNASSGGTELDSVTLVLEAEYTSACPKCCFPPETPILMPDGTEKPIGEIKQGELIANQSGAEPVAEVIEREDRRMVELTFADGRTLVLSIDHPIHVEGKGPCAVEPGANYKGHKTSQLEIGDWATLESRLKLKLVKIAPHPYRGKVYTFKNRLFYANGILVY